MDESEQTLAENEQLIRVCKDIMGGGHSGNLGWSHVKIWNQVGNSANSRLDLGERMND